MREPKISKDFTIEDIQKIREYYSKKMKKMKFEDFCAEISKEADEFEKEIEEFRKESAVI